MTRSSSRLLTALAAALAVVALVMVVVRLERLPSGPVPIVYDREQCAHCRMLVSEPAFAAQLQTRDGRVLNFDDPGCLVAYEAAHHPEEHAVYLHELRGERFLPRDRAAFVPVEHSPMGYGLGVVEIGTEGAISYDEARTRMFVRGRGEHVVHPAPGASP